ncbi:MAG: hypothetical protein WDN27_05435 [Candidatus Saccharibacteria bacterium]
MLSDVGLGQQVGCQGIVAFGGVAVGNALGVIVQRPYLVNDDDAPRTSPSGTASYASKGFPS